MFAMPIKTFGPYGTQIKYILFTVKNKEMSAQFSENIQGSVSAILAGSRTIYTTDRWAGWEERYEELRQSKDYFSYIGDLGDGFSGILFVPLERLEEAVDVYVKIYGLWLLFSLASGMFLANFFSKGHYESYLEMLLSNRRLSCERDSLQMENCLYELLSKRVQPQDAIWEKCVKNHIYIGRKHLFFVAVREETGSGFDSWMEKRAEGALTSSYRINFLEGGLLYLVCSDEPRERIEEEITRLSEAESGICAGGLIADVGELRNAYEKARRLLEKNMEPADRTAEPPVELEGAAAKEAKAEKPAVKYQKRSIMDILDFLHEHYLEDNFSANYLAGHFETSVSNISHFFKKSMGITISQYIEQMKLEQAKEMLKNSNKSISEIAGELRYANSTVFIGMFKKNERLTPGGYREMLQKKEGV